MKIMNALTVRYLKLNPKRTMITLLGIIISVAMITALAGFSFSFLDFLRRGAIAEYGEWHVFYNVYEDDMSDGLSSEEIALKIEESDIFDRTEIQQLEGEDEDGNVYSYYQVKGYTDKRLASGFANEAQALADQYNVNLNFNNDLMRVDGLYSNGNYYTTLLGVAGVLIVLVVGGSVLVISNAFAISASERTRQYGVLKSVGATKRQVRNSVLFEGTALALIAIPMGLAAGYAGEAIVLYITDNLIGDMITFPGGVALRAVVSIPAFVVAIVFSYATIMLSAWLPARRTSKVSPVDAIRQSREVKIRPGRVKTSPLTEKVFGFEGALAAKALKRNRGKYRATVIALTLSIVLFMAAGSFSRLLSQSVAMTYQTYDYNVYVYISYGSEYTWQELEDVSDKLAGIEGVDGYSASSSPIYGYTELTDDSYTADGLKYISGVNEDLGMQVNIIALTDSEIEQMCQELGISAQDMLDTDQYSAILINNTGVMYLNDGEKSTMGAITPYKNMTGSTLTVDMPEDSVNSGSYNIKIAGELDYLPEMVSNHVSFTSINLIASWDTCYDWLVQAGADPQDSYNMFAYIKTEDAQGYIDALEKSGLLTEYDIYGNSDKEARDAENMNLVIKIFGYGFVILLSIIAVTSVIGTISTSIAMRRREFATLKSVGLTPGGMGKMLNLESLFYGLRSLAFGLPLGILASYVMYRFVGESLYFPYELPVKDIIIVIAGVLIITFATMHYSRAKQRRDNIVDALSSEIV